MSDFLNEKVPRMPPISMTSIEELGDKLLEILCPGALQKPTAIDFCELVDHELAKYGIHVYPAKDDELGDRLAATDPTGDREINILVARDLWDALFQGGRIAHRARATIAHEVGHAVLHVPIVRRRMKSPMAPMLLNRVSRDSLKPYEDPEWQAWALAGCIMAPRKVLQTVEVTSTWELAELFGVSEGMMKAHIKRLRLTRRFEGL